MIFPRKVKKHFRNVFFKSITYNYKNKNKLMQHFHIIVAISSSLPQDQRGEKSTGETGQQILEDALLTHFVKRRKLKKK